MMIKYLLEKEFKQLVRNPFLPRLILLFPCMLLLLFPWAATMDIEDVHVGIVDHDRSQASRRLVEQIAASQYFLLDYLPATFSAGTDLVERGDLDVVLEIPRHFEKDLATGRPAQALIAANAVNGVKGGLASSYLNNIISRTEFPVLAVRNLYNPYLDYKTYMIPALMVMAMVLICGFLPCLNIVSEKETGTIEQINVTPVGKFTFILSKLLPYWIIGLLILSICMLLAVLIYGVRPVGNVLCIYLSAMIFILVVSGFGLVISNYSSTMQQSMFVMFFCILVLVLMSGLFTPISSMPRWAQVITWFNPLRYFMDVMRMVYLKGCGLPDLWGRLGVLCLFALFANGWAVLSYRKKK